MKVVEPGLAHCDDALVAQQLLELVEPLGLGAARLVWIDAQRRVDALLALDYRQRAAARIDPRPDGDDAADARLARTGDEVLGRIGARVEVRVRVGHATATAGGSSTRGKSGVAASMPTAAAAVPLRTRSSERSSAG